MLEEPTSLRIEDPGVRALFSESARFQSWLDVEAALAEAQAELGIIPAAAARTLCAKANRPEGVLKLPEECRPFYELMQLAKLVPIE